jgi:DDE superfamily endonuclease
MSFLLCALSLLAGVTGCFAVSDEDLAALAAAVTVFTAAVQVYNTALVAVAAAAGVVLLAPVGTRVHDVWVRERASPWWLSEVPRYSDEEFRQYFRVCRATFRYIVELVRNQVQKADTRLRKAVKADLIVAVALRRLATGDSFQTIGALFGVNRTSAQKYTARFVRALVEHQESFIKFPASVEEVEILSQGAQRLGQHWGGWPGAVLMVDGTHIHVPFGQRRYGHSDFRNRKGKMSHNVQVVVDYQTRVRSIVAGRPGTTGDARIWRESEVGKAAMNGTLFHGAVYTLPTGERIAYHCLGDGIYPPCQLMIKATPAVGRSDEYAWMSYCQSVTRQPIEHFNGRMKGRWRTLHNTADYDLTLIPYVVIACSILHNICLDHAEAFDERLAPPCELVKSLEEEAELPHNADMDETIALPDALSSIDAVAAIRKQLWKQCPEKIKKQGVLAWRKSILQG